ncbi:DNA repair exonuclease [Halobacillus salinarum]|uniref:DNA repair exonuclease n=1 Tax=Halobacillus salinarum TaxID=2932257 RepID=A0ABY4EHP5_9BACI|nr:DNA repair exonuclease [Halobacillus salinarum]UOQ43520.1 DNA repair exonuclease [Halobacillus salinarum]
MGRDLRFIHSADLHLDSPFIHTSHLPEQIVEQLRKSTFEAFDRLIEAAIYEKVDFILIVGDLFNEASRSLKAQIHLRNGFRKLEKESIQVFVSHGNHDFMNGTKYPIDYPENVVVFKDESVQSVPFYKNGRHAANILGFSYVQQRVTDNKVHEFKRTADEVIHIAMLHGSLFSHAGEHEVYAPFLMEELFRQFMDYWALGHIHARHFLSSDPPVLYPGNIQGRSRKEEGVKGAYLVDFSHNGWEFTFLPLQSILFEETIIDCRGLEKPQDLETLFLHTKEELQSLHSKVLATLYLKGDSGNLERWKTEGLIDSWVEEANREEELENSWVYFMNVKVIDLPSYDEEKLRKSRHISGEFLRGIEELTDTEWEEWLASLYKHKQFYPYLYPLTEEDKAELIEEVKQSTLSRLLKTGGSDDES